MTNAEIKKGGGEKSGLMVISMNGTQNIRRK